MGTFQWVTVGNINHVYPVIQLKVYKIREHMLSLICLCYSISYDQAFHICFVFFLFLTLTLIPGPHTLSTMIKKKNLKNS